MFALSITKLLEFSPDVLLLPTNGLFLASLITLVTLIALPFASIISSPDVFAIALMFGILASFIAFIMSSGDAMMAALATLVYVLISDSFNSSPVLPLSKVIVLAPEPLSIVNCGI